MTDNEKTLPCERYYQQELWASDCLCTSGNCGSLGVFISKSKSKAMAGDKFDATGRCHYWWLSVFDLGCGSIGFDGQYGTVAANRPNPPSDRHQEAPLGRFEAARKARCVRRLNREPLSLLSVLRQHACRNITFNSEQSFVTYNNVCNA